MQYAYSITSAGLEHLSSGGENMNQNSTLATILQMTIIYFIVFLPFPLIWTFRNGVGFLLDSNIVRFFYSPLDIERVHIITDATL